jgi:hypothetical protein
MYRVEKKDGRVLVYDAKDKCVYSAPETSYLIFNIPNTGGIQVAVVGKMTDFQLLTALANAVKLED